MTERTVNRSCVVSVTKPGYVTVEPDGKVSVEGFEFEFQGDKSPLNLSGCQEAFHVGAAWAIQQIVFAMTPEGFSKGGIGFAVPPESVWCEHLTREIEKARAAGETSVPFSALHRLIDDALNRA